MKKINIILLISVALLAIQPVLSQTYMNDPPQEEQLLNGAALTPTVLQNLGFSNAPNPKNALLENNSVFIRQIGDYNETSIRTNTFASEINLLQNGNYNNTGLDYTAKTAVADLIQNGNSNRITDFVLAPDADISLDLIQDGDNLNFERNGVNEITKSLKFRQTEASPSIIIRSFN